MKSSREISTLLNTWLQTGDEDALNSLEEEFSASCQSHDNDGPSAFKEFLLELKAAEDASQADEPEHEAIEPLYNFTGFCPSV
jgi:hypothetical protein